MSDIKISELLGKVISKIDKSVDEIIFTLENGDQYKMYHMQDCCESVGIEDINGDFCDLLNTPITLAEESTSTENPTDITKEYQDSFTWTFYRLATIKGFVDIRWYGESNGYYSESVDFVKLPHSYD